MIGDGVVFDGMLSPALIHVDTGATVGSYQVTPDGSVNTADRQVDPIQRAVIHGVAANFVALYQPVVGIGG